MNAAEAVMARIIKILLLNNLFMFADIISTKIEIHFFYYICLQSMMDNCRYEFDKATGILFKYYYGKITIDDIADSWNKAIKEGLIPPETKGFILDYRKAAFDFDISEYEKIPEYYRQHLNIFGGTKIAIITENPKDIVVPVLVNRKDSGYVSVPFTTV